MGELYNPYPRLPKNIRQIGERDQIMKLYVEDYVNTYLKRLFPAGGQDLRAGLLLGEMRTEGGTPYLFVDGAMEMEQVTESGEKVVFTEEAWKKAYQTMEQRFPRRSVLGWFLCGAPGCLLSPLNYWKQHSQYFSARHQLMYLNCGLEGEEAIYTASEDGFYKLRGYCIYYERNQMMQDYMVSRSEARRVESGVRDDVIRDFRQKMEGRKEHARRQRSAASVLATACGVLTVAVLAGGVVMFNNYHKMKAMESVIASALPEGTAGGWSGYLSGGGYGEEDEVDIEEIPGEVYPTHAEIVIQPEAQAAAEAGGQAAAAGTQSQPSSPQPGTGADGTLSAAGIQGGQQAPSSAAGIQEGQQVPSSAAGIQGGQQASSSVAGAQGGQLSQPSGISGGQASAGSTAQDAEPVQVPADAVTHIVQEGETLYGICMERYSNLSHLPEICQWNQLTDENKISIGQKLYLPQ